MQKDALALVLLLGVMVLGLIGAGAVHQRLEPAGGAGRARARRRAGAARTGASVERLDQRCGARARARGSSQWLRASGGPLSPVDVGRDRGGRAGSLLGLLLLDAAVAAGRRVRRSATRSSSAGCAGTSSAARNQRRDAFMDQLPDLARMLSNGTQAGLSIAGRGADGGARARRPGRRRDGGAWSQEMRLGQPLDRALERLQERLPSREVAVLMTTIIIQQRAGGDTVRALQELGGTLEARKDLIREIRTLLSGVGVHLLRRRRHRHRARSC